ncbi:BNR Asp-box repeat domain protein [Apiospora sp. TS-2023a]
MQTRRAAVFGLLSFALPQALAALLPSKPAATLAERATATISDVTIFSPPSNAGWVDPRVLYARAVPLSGSGALLATWENYSPEPPLVYFPIFKSTDKGQTWAKIGEVRDTENNWGMRYQPTLFELPQAVGQFPKGTVIAAGNSIPTDLSKTKIDVYASTDGGVTWTFASSVASGGEARPNNGLTPVWEPMFMMFNNELVIYYSDQRDTKYGQKLVHQTTKDLKTWGAIVDDVRDDANYAARPGMPAVAPMPDGRYIYAYEQCGNDGCRVHYRLPDSPVAGVLTAPEFSLQSTKGTKPTSSPFVVVWNNDTIVLSAGSGSQIFVNRKLGDPSAWVEYATPQPGAYSRGLALLGPSDPDALLLIGAGGLPPSTTNRVSVSVIDLRAMLGSSGGKALSSSDINSNSNTGVGSGQAASNSVAVTSGAKRRRSLPQLRRG